MYKSQCVKEKKRVNVMHVPDEDKNFIETLTHNDQFKYVCMCIGLLSHEFGSMN